MQVPEKKPTLASELLDKISGESPLHRYARRHADNIRQIGVDVLRLNKNNARKRAGTCVLFIGLGQSSGIDCEQTIPDTENITITDTFYTSRDDFENALSGTLPVKMKFPLAPNQEEMLNSDVVMMRVFLYDRRPESFKFLVCDVQVQIGAAQSIWPSSKATPQHVMPSLLNEDAEIGHSPSWKVCARAIRCLVRLLFRVLPFVWN